MYFSAGMYCKRVAMFCKYWAKVMLRYVCIESLCDYAFILSGSKITVFMSLGAN